MLAATPQLHRPTVANGHVPNTGIGTIVMTRPPNDDLGHGRIIAERGQAVSQVSDIQVQDSRTNIDIRSNG